MSALNKGLITTIQIGARSLGQTMKQESPTLLTGLGVAGLITTTVLAVRATPKAILLLEEERDRREKESPHGAIDPLTKLDVVKTTWKCYIPAALVGVSTIGCIVGANTINLRRNAALASIYSLAETALKEYQEKVVEQIGKNKEGKIRDALAVDKMERHPVVDREIIKTGRGNQLFFDGLSGRYFLSEMEDLRKTINDFNFRLMSEMFLPLNDFYYEIGLEKTDIGADMGWDINNGQMVVDFTARETKDGDNTCFALTYRHLVAGPCIMGHRS